MAKRKTAPPQLSPGEWALYLPLAFALWLGFLWLIDTFEWLTPVMMAAAAWCAAIWVTAKALLAILDILRGR